MARASVISPLCRTFPVRVPQRTYYLGNPGNFHHPVLLRRDSHLQRILDARLRYHLHSPSSLFLSFRHRYRCPLRHDVPSPLQVPPKRQITQHEDVLSLDLDVCLSGKSLTSNLAAPEKVHILLSFVFATLGQRNNPVCDSILQRLICEHRDDHVHVSDFDRIAQRLHSD